MKRYPALAAVLACACLIAACGSDNSGNTTSAASTVASKAASTGNEVTGTPIKVGTICTCSGAQGSGLIAVKTLSEAWVKWVNTHGGLNGHPVQLIFKDDGGDATASAARARELVNEKVMAIIGNFSFQQDAWASIVTKAGIPVVGAPGQSPVEASNPDWFPVGSNVSATFFQQLKGIADSGKTKYATMFCTEAPACKQLKGILPAFLKIQNSPVKVVNSSDASASQPSYAANCLAAKNAGANSVSVFQSQSVTARIMQQCQQQGWSPTLIGANGSASHNDKGSLPAGGVLLTLPTIGVDDRTTEGGKLLGEIMAAEAPGLESGDTYTESLGAPFAGWQLFARVAETAKLTPTSTPADVKKGLYALKDETLGGLTAPLNFVKGQPTFNGCTFRSSYSDGKWTADPKARCMTKGEIGSVLKLFSKPS